MLSPEQVNKLAGELCLREGGYVNHPDDPGGETKYGISKRSYPQEDIKNLSLNRAIEIYKQDWIYKWKIDQLQYDHAEQILDWFVHSGVTNPTRVLQQYVKIPIDGRFGPQTIHAVNNISPREILHQRAFFLLKLTKHPFIVGWFNRLVELGLWQE